MQKYKSQSVKGTTFNKSRGGLSHTYSYFSVNNNLTLLPSCLAQKQKTAVSLFTKQTPRINCLTDNHVQSHHIATHSGDDASNTLCSPHKGIIPVNGYTLSLHPVLLQVVVTWDKHPKTSKLLFRGFQLNKAGVTDAPLDTAPTFKHQQHAISDDKFPVLCRFKLVCQLCFRLSRVFLFHLSHRSASFIFTSEIQVVNRI